MDTTECPFGGGSVEPGPFLSRSHLSGLDRVASTRCAPGGRGLIPTRGPLPRRPSRHPDPFLDQAGSMLPRRILRAHSNSSIPGPWVPGSLLDRRDLLLIVNPWFVGVASRLSAPLA